MQAERTGAGRQCGITVLRIVVGAVFMAHGCQKLFVFKLPGVAAAFEKMHIPAPYPSAVLATAAEFLGGLMLVLGLGTRLATLPLIATMLVALFMVHLHGGFFLPTGYEYVLVMLAANVTLLLAGPGALAVDHLIGRRRNTGTR